MKILAVDVGTGTQDILLFDTDEEIENCLQMVMPSPTVLVAKAIRQATAAGRPILLGGVMMGGGPCAWAAEGHLRAGHTVYATPEAARTFNDDLSEVERIGVKVVAEREANKLKDVVCLEMRDFDYEAIARAFASFGVSLRPDALAIAVFDHGNAPPGYSDRQFRFDYLTERIQAQNRLSAFAFPADQIPGRMTRMQAVARSAPQGGLPVMLMDTAPAAVLGALEDRRVGDRRPVFVVNIGNFHTLAFRLGHGGIEGVFEHHTGELDQARLELYLHKLADGTLRHEELFNDMGHGALIINPSPTPLEFLCVTGPRRNLMRGSDLRPYLAVPYGDMMMTGCYGLLRAFAELFPAHGEVIEQALERSRT
jgi:uncharacterized protein (DUF1786 family)